MNIKPYIQNAFPAIIATLIISFSCNNTTTSNTAGETSVATAEQTISSDTLTPNLSYEGFGAVTKGGKDKPVVHVTNLNASGPGSLQAAMGSNRTIVFDVAGTIDNFRWDGSGRNAVTNLTVDGSSAPSPGITLDNNNNGYCLTFEQGCHDIILKNIRIRNAGMDGISVVGAYNMIFDHISVAGSGDGSLDISQGSHNITVQWCIFGPGREGWAGPMLIAFPPTKDISVHHNLFASYGAGAGERNPFVHNATNYKPNETSDLMCDFTNNLVWNWGKSNGDYGYGSSVDYGGSLQARNNFYQSNAQKDHAILINHESKLSKLYASGNKSGNDGVDLNNLSNVTKPWTVAPVTMYDACTAARLVLAFAGPRPLDKTDQAIVDAIALKACPQINIKAPVQNTATKETTADSKLLISTGYDDAGDITTVQGPYNSFSTSVVKSGAGSFRSEVRQNEPNNFRGEISYEGLDPAEGVYEYDVYYENWKAFADGGHTIQWRPAGGGGAILSLQNYGGKFTVVRSIYGINSYGPESPKEVVPGKWYHMKWEIKWADDGSGYIRFYIDNKLYYSFKGTTTDSGGTPSLKLGQERWPNSGSTLKETTVVYYDNLKVTKR